MLTIILSGVYVTACLLLILVVLLQQGKGGDIAAAFGGGGSQAAFGARAGASLLTRVTTVLGVLFMVGALGLAIIGQRGPESVLGGIDTPEPAPAGVEEPATLPAPAADEAADDEDSAATEDPQ